ncbi:MAG: glycerate kinase type-2 family protein [Terriglobia bacterium]
MIILSHLLRRSSRRFSWAMFDLKETAKRVFLETLKAIEPESIIKQRLRVDGETLSLGSEQIPLDTFTEVVLIGLGKASLKMGSAVENLLGDRIKRGLLVTDRRSKMTLRSEVLVGGHPLPDGNSLIAGERIVELVRSCGESSLIVFLVSGGGSALVELPVSLSISLDDLRVTNQGLIGCGATIREINIIRKSLSRIKGGGLGWLARNSTCVGLYISDVNPGDLRSIASNPLLPEDVGENDALDVVKRFDLIDKLPRSVLTVLQQESAKRSSRDWSSTGFRPLTMLLLDNSNAVHAAAEQARQLGFRVEVDADLIEGDYQNVADELLDRLLNLKASHPNEPVCVISGGEVSCIVRRGGIGGRNQEFVLYSAARLGALGIREGAAVLSCGTDGIDGNSNAAGAVADAELVIKAAQHGIDASIFISGNDSHSFFKKAGGLVVTGPTGNNVRDLRILMAQ